MSSQRCRGAHIAKTESLIAQYVPSSGPSHHYRGAKRLGKREKAQSGEGGWTCAKKFLEWILDMQAGTVTLTERKLEEILTLVDIPATQRKMGRKDLERRFEKLRSMNLTGPEAMAHFFHIQFALNQGRI